MVIWIAVAVGGAVGAVARHAVNHLTHQHSLASRFPAGTMFVNIAGCLIIGVLAGLIAAERIRLPFHWREFVFVGVLGGFTTFSTFGLDTLLLARSGATRLLILNVAGQVVGGLLAVWAGYQLGLGSR